MQKPLLERSNMCGHTKEQRMLRGTWCTPETQKAVEKGYELIKIHEVFHFKPENRRTGLFAEYVNKWLKLKQESAGWQEKLPLGQYLGQFTDELGGDTIVEFVSGGAKNYGYLTKKGKTECKVRGFTLNYKTLQTLNYETMKNNILNELDDPLQEQRKIPITIPDYLDRDQVTEKIKITKCVKNYGLVFDKRVIDPTTRVSTPYGYSWFGAEVDLLLSL